MKAKSIKGQTAKGIKAILDGDDEFKPTLAVVFISADSEREAVCKILSERNIQVFGSSAGSGFVDGEVETDSIVILLLEIKTAYYYLDLRESGERTTKEIAGQIGHDGLNKFKKPAFLVVSGGLSADGDEIVEGIEGACGKGITIFGGLAADKLLMKRTYVFTTDRITEQGLLALVLDENEISVTGIAVGGWKPVGMERVITHSEGNIVYTIDNEPALDFIARYAGLKNLEFDNGVALLIGINFQLQIEREGKHPAMRTPMTVNKNDRSIVFAGSVPQGSKVRFCLLPGFEVIQKTLRDFSDYKKERGDADALLMFSCAGRQLSLGPYVTDEIEGVKNIWSAPMAGFFCYGEIGRIASGQHGFFNMTCSLAILKEK